MDDLHLRECQSLTERARGKLHPDEFRAVVTYSRMEIQSELDDMRLEFFQWFTDSVVWLGLDYSLNKLYGLAYAMDIPRLHDERNMEETARVIGSTRAAISVQAQNFIKEFKMQPSRWMRDDDAVENSRDARNNYCEDEEL
jgi:hypothetical protein